MKFNLSGSTWRRANENLALPISIMALVFTGASFCSDQQEAAERRAIEQSVVWRGEPLPDNEGVRLTQPNEAVAIQRVTLTFPRSLSLDPISLPPSRVEVRGTWLEPGMEQLLKGCASPGNIGLMENQMPVRIVTHSSVAGRNRETTSAYTLSFIATVDDLGIVKVQVDDVAIAGLDGNNALPADFDWRPAPCVRPPAPAQ